MKVVLTAAADLRGQDTVDLEFTVRDHSAARKWTECLRSVGSRAPWKWGYTHGTKDLPRLEARIKKSILTTDLRDTYLKEYIVNNDVEITQEVVNATHRFIEDHQDLAAGHLELHNDIHYWEGITTGTDNNNGWQKIMWNPPGLYIPFDDIDYTLYTTEPCDNFLMQDFAHVGRDPFNSFTFRDDRSLGTSCVIQHAVTSGFKWIKSDDSSAFIDNETEFRQWVRDNMAFFGQCGVADEYDPKLSFGRIILADPVENYQLDDRYQFILRVRTE